MTNSRENWVHTRLAPQPIAEIPAWSQSLKERAADPLEFCPNFCSIAARHEAWWTGNLEGPPLFLASIGKNPEVQITKGLDLLQQPDEWFNNRLKQLRQIHRAGDTLPTIRVDFGPVMLSGLLGGRTEFLSDTTWTHSYIQDDWENEPDWLIREDHPWWTIFHALFEITARNAPGRFLVMGPDLGGSGDVLLNLRGAEKLCLDVIDQPDRVKKAVDAIYPSWRKAYREMWSICYRHRAGFIHWAGLWSNQAYMIPACDFNYLIGHKAFNELFLEDIARQAATIGRAIFHLDGPGAAKHCDALLEIPEIQAIQYVTGAGNSALTHLKMLKNIQAKGRSLQVIAPASEVLELCSELRPESLNVVVSDFNSVQEIDDLYAALCKKYHPAG